jgi:hypothetical protein
LFRKSLASGGEVSRIEIPCNMQEGLDMALFSQQGKVGLDFPNPVTQQVGWDWLPNR